MNNAGRQQFCESIDDLTTEAFDATFKTNVYATFWITKAALRHLSSGSVIINTTSVGRTNRAISCWIMRRPKRRSPSSPNRWRNNWHRRGFGLTPSRRVPTGRCCSAAEVSHRKNREIWRAVPAWSTRSTGGDRTAVCHAGGTREQLHVRSGLVFRRWHRDLITRGLPANDDRRNVNESTHLSWPASR